MKKVIALTALLCLLAIGCFACGSPRGSGNGSIKAQATKAPAASVNVASAKPQFESARQLRAVEAVTTAETPAIATKRSEVSTTVTISRDTTATLYRQEPFDHLADIAKVRKLPNRSGYNGFAGVHAPRADV